MGQHLEKLGSRQAPSGACRSQEEEEEEEVFTQREYKWMLKALTGLLTCLLYSV